MVSTLPIATGRKSREGRKPEGGRDGGSVAKQTQMLAQVRQRNRKALPDKEVETHKAGRADLEYPVIPHGANFWRAYGAFDRIGRMIRPRH
jgi:hypothetical protein